MKTRICNHFGVEINIYAVNGNPNVLTFRHTAHQIIHDFYSHPKNDDPEMEKIRIVTAAANLLKADVKSVSQSKDVYPRVNDMSNSGAALSFLPESLCTMLKSLIPGIKYETKVASIEQAIMQAARPRGIIAPLQLGLGVQLHYQLGSRFLIDQLHALRICVPSVHG